MEKNGFTLIDLIVSIAIFGVITGAVVANFRAGQRNDSVRQSADIAASLLRRAQTMTLTGTQAPGSEFPEGGWGVRFDSSDTGTLTLFADINGNDIFNEGEEVAVKNFPEGAYFSTANTIDVVFSPPEADVLFNGAESPASKSISITAEESDVIKSVIIYRLSGQIRVE